MTGSLDLQSRIAAIKATPISATIGEYVDLRRAGSEMVGRCPFHSDSTPSMFLNDQKGVFHCFGCEASGDVIDFVQQIEGCDFSEACHRLENSAMDYQRPKALQASRDTVSAARSIWYHAKPIEGTPAEKYLASRALPLECLPDQPYLRFARLSFDGSARLYPALVAAVQNIDNEVMGIHRIYLNEDGSKLDTTNVKRSLGLIRANAIWLSHDWHFCESQPSHLVVAESLEDALSVARIHREAGYADAYEGADDDGERKVYWATGGAGMLSAVDIPDWIKTITIAIDNDAAGRNSAHALIRRLAPRDITCNILAPPSLYKDFNEFLQHWVTREPSWSERPWSYVMG